MAIKQAEADFARLCARYNIWAHKWTDVMYCPNCHRPIFMTQHTDQKDINPEAQQSIVDYLIFTGKQPHWVECKGKGGDTRFDFADLSLKQRNFLDSWVHRGLPCWLFLTLGNGKAPSGRKAWLIPWELYLMVESEIGSSGRKSIAYLPSAAIEFSSWELEWGERGTGWIFPKTHLMAIAYHADQLTPLYGDK